MNKKQPVPKKPEKSFPVPVETAGCFYGVGVGPGDPELITVKALRTLEACHRIAVPDSGAPVSAAWTIALRACPAIAEKPRMNIPMPMIRDREALEEVHRRESERIAERLDGGEDIAFLTLGDPSIYSTCAYLHRKLRDWGYKTELIPGVPSFCAAFARLNEPLSDPREAIHIIPAAYEETCGGLELKGVRILMKSGKQIGKIKNLLQRKYPGASVKMVERCGMEGEKIYGSLEEIDEEAGYFSVIIVRDP